MNKESIISFGFIGLAIYWIFKSDPFKYANPVFSETIDMEENPVPMGSLVARVKAKIRRLGLDKFKTEQLLNKLDIILELFPNAPEYKKEKLIDLFGEVMKEVHSIPSKSFNIGS